MITRSMIAKSTAKEIAEAVVDGHIEQLSGHPVTSLSVGGMSVSIRGNHREVIDGWRRTIEQLVDDIRTERAA